MFLEQAKSKKAMVVVFQVARLVRLWTHHHDDIMVAEMLELNLEWETFFYITGKIAQ